MKTRNTMQKSLVINTVKSLNTHPSAEEIYKEIIKTNPSVSKGTVYRNLGILADKGEILRIELANASDRFDVFTQKHCHFICDKCKKVFDIDIERIEELDKLRSEDFFIKGYDLIFKGTCKRCMEEN